MGNTHLCCTLWTWQRKAVHDGTVNWALPPKQPGWLKSVLLATLLLTAVRSVRQGETRDASMTSAVVYSKILISLKTTDITTHNYSIYNKAILKGPMHKLRDESKHHLKNWKIWRVNSQTACISEHQNCFFPMDHHVTRTGSNWHNSNKTLSFVGWGMSPLWPLLLQPPTC